MPPIYPQRPKAPNVIGMGGGGGGGGGRYNSAADLLGFNDHEEEGGEEEVQTLSPLPSPSLSDPRTQVQGMLYSFEMFNSMNLIPFVFSSS